MERRSEVVRQGVVVYCVCVDAGILTVSAVGSSSLGVVESKALRIRQFSVYQIFQSDDTRKTESAQRKPSALDSVYLVPRKTSLITIPLFVDDFFLLRFFVEEINRRYVKYMKYDTHYFLVGKDLSFLDPGTPFNVVPRFD